MHISIISGSTRINRNSHRVALALQKYITSTSGHTAEVLDLGAYNFPIMEEVLHRHPNPPEGLQDFADRIDASDAHILVSPEYNGSYTSALKNALDYLKERQFANKAIGVASVTTGALGGMRAAQAMQHLALGVGGYASPKMLTTGKVTECLDENGNIIDPTYEKKLSMFTNSFLFLAEAVSEKKKAMAEVAV